MHVPWGYRASLKSENEQMLIYFNSNLESGRMYSYKTKWEQILIGYKNIICLGVLTT